MEFILVEIVVFCETFLLYHGKGGESSRMIISPQGDHIENPMHVEEHSRLMLGKAKGVTEWITSCFK